MKGIVDIPTRNGGESIKQLFGSQVFGKSKPANLISHLASYVSNANDLILDFFSGSGTTAHAVMQLNAEDGGNRRFIVCNFPKKPMKSPKRARPVSTRLPKSPKNAFAARAGRFQAAFKTDRK